jgi:hypothetical protein
MNANNIIMIERLIPNIKYDSEKQLNFKYKSVCSNGNNNSEEAGEAVTLWNCVREVPVSYFIWGTILVEVFFSIFLSTSRQMPGQKLKIHHDRLFRHPFQFTNHAFIRRHTRTFSATDSVVK